MRIKSIKSFDEWKETLYNESLQLRDYKSCDFLIEYYDAIKYGYEAALTEIKKGLTNEGLSNNRIDDDVKCFDERRTRRVDDRL